MILISTSAFLRMVGPWGQVAAISLVGIANLVENTRSVFALLLAVACIVVIGHFLVWSLRGRRLPKLLFLIILLGGGIFYQGVVSIYGMAASSGLLGEEAQDKY